MDAACSGIPAKERRRLTPKLREGDMIDRQSTSPNSVVARPQKASYYWSGLLLGQSQKFLLVNLARGAPRPEMFCGYLPAVMGMIYSQAHGTQGHDEPDLRCQSFECAQNCDFLNMVQIREHTDVETTRKQRCVSRSGGREHLVTPKVASCEIWRRRQAQAYSLSKLLQ